MRRVAWTTTFIVGIFPSPGTVVCGFHSLGRKSIQSFQLNGPTKSLQDEKERIKEGFSRTGSSIEVA
jgi:hypothetical protein